MIKKILLLALLLSNAYNVFAETVYVTDTLKIEVRSGMSTQHKILTMLPSGSPLEVVNHNADTGYTAVQINENQTGYILTRYTKKQPTARWLLNDVKKNNAQLQSDLKTAQQTLTTLSASNKKNAQSNNTLAKEKIRLSNELAEIKQTAANAILLKQQRDQFQERLVNIERENEKLKRETQTLQDSANQDWFLYGGILAFFGIFFGLLIPKISWHKRTNSWDSL
ncbi:MAG: TIGR04211 family SH3 domain-containing protein [Methylococcales bacterium]|jgi:SH3 domain protein|nr:TIGR04211 family SH3 domain-containing protein [Methylococcaceae bacterium]HIL41610.1 TIGR04211 family SH3 domain-containing protein [Methylococcales bacterium]